MEQLERFRDEIFRSIQKIGPPIYFEEIKITIAKLKIVFKFAYFHLSPNLLFFQCWFFAFAKRKTDYYRNHRKIYFIQ